MGRTDSVLQPLRTLFEAGTTAGFLDGELLDRFTARRGPVAEIAFAALVERHGPMVLRVCRNVLQDTHDADDAFQAAFLVLARRARAIRRRDSIGPWLYGVALRVASCSRKAAARRRTVERRAASGVEPSRAGGDMLDDGPVLHEEVGRLPSGHRAAVVLCYFEGLTHEEAAEQLGWPVGTVRSRLAWARDRLRSRLARRGLGAPAGILAAGPLAGPAMAPVPSALVAVTIKAAMQGATAGMVPAAVAALVGDVLRSLIMSKLKLIAVVGLATGLVATAGVGMVAARPAPASPARNQPEPQRPGGRDPAEPANDGDPVPTTLVTSGSADSAGFMRRQMMEEPPKILAARLENARRIYNMRLGLVRNAQISALSFEEARNDVIIIGALIQSQNDECFDQLEMLQAQLAVRMATLETAKNRSQMAVDVLARNTRLAEKLAISKDEVRVAELELKIRESQQQARNSEVEEVRVRIAQVRRRLAELEPLAKSAAILLEPADVRAPQPPAAAPGRP